MQQIYAEYCSDSDISSVLGLLGSEKMCRKCHSAYARYNALPNSITEKLKTVISERSRITCTLDIDTTQSSSKRARLADLPVRSVQSTSKSSPDVSVSRFVQTTSHNNLSLDLLDKHWIQTTQDICFDSLPQTSWESCCLKKSASDFIEESKYKKNDFLVGREIQRDIRKMASINVNSILSSESLAEFE